VIVEAAFLPSVPPFLFPDGSDNGGMKKRKIHEQLKKIDDRLRNAEAYVARNQNVESSSFLHSKDWEGKSGHPLWMKNFMVPATKRARARKEKALERIIAKERAKKSPRRKPA
jgi:hypothetical protein